MTLSTDLKKGDKIKCIKNFHPSFQKTEGKIYTILYTDEYSFHLKELYGCFYYPSSYFKKVYSLRDRLDLIKELIK
jgi:hypothetical protein